jgi:hypothetical protein
MRIRVSLCAVLILVAGVTGSKAACKSPVTGAIDFFSELEAATLKGKRQVDRATFERLFTNDFKTSTTPLDLQRVLITEQKKFGIDEFDRPVRERILGQPTVESGGMTSGGESISVGLPVATRSGTTIYKVALSCEGGTWKARSFGFQSSRF